MVARDAAGNEAEKWFSIDVAELMTSDLVIQDTTYTVDHSIYLDEADLEVDNSRVEFADGVGQAKDVVPGVPDMLAENLFNSDGPLAGHWQPYYEYSYSGQNRYGKVAEDTNVVLSGEKSIRLDAGSYTYKYGFEYQFDNPTDLTIGNTPSTTNNPTLIITGTIEVGAELFVNGMSHGIAESSSLMIEHVLYEGTNMILIEAVDAAKNTAFQTAEVILDTQPPVLVVTGPAKYMITNQDTVTVVGIVDGHKDLTVDGTLVIADEDGSFSHVVSLASGENVIEVKATDEATNVAIATLTIELDQDPPYVEITDPDDGLKTSDGVVEITILADLDAMLWINGRPTANDEGNTVRTVLLLEGINTITVTGRDPAGNEASDSIEVFLDTMPPVLFVTTPAASEVWTNVLTLDIQGFAYNATGVTINGEAADSFDKDGTWAFSHSASLTNGENNITIEANDKVNTVSAFRKAWVSTSDPKLVVNTVDSVVTTPSVTISGETEVGIPTVFVEVGGLTWEFPVRYDGDFEFTLNLDDGTHDVKVSVDDVYGNTNSQQTGTFTVKQKEYISDGGEEDDTFQIEPIHIGLILAVIGITLIVAAFLAVYKISRREE